MNIQSKFWGKRHNHMLLPSWSSCLTPACLKSFGTSIFIRPFLYKWNFLKGKFWFLKFDLIQLEKGMCMQVWVLNCVQLFVTPWKSCLADSSVHWNFQARILEWVAISYFRGSSWPRDCTCVSFIGRQICYPCANRATNRKRQKKF